MAGNKAGGLKAGATNKQRYGHDFYRLIGAKGGLVGDRSTKGFAHPDNKNLASEAGRKGGSAPRKNK